MKKFIYSKTKQKLLLLLAAGVALGLSRSSKKQWHIASSLPQEFKKIDRHVLQRLVREFRSERLVRLTEDSDGTVTVVLTQEGKRFAQKYNPKYPPPRTPAVWDGQWRVVIFDIPEKHRKARDAFRKELKTLGFYELQKSTWIHPFDHTEVLNVLTEIYRVRNHVRVLIVKTLFPDADIRLHFDL